MEPKLLEAVKTYLLCQLLQQYEPTMACDPKSLAASAACFMCADARVLQAIQTQLLCSVLSAIEGGTTGASGVTCGIQNPPAVDPGVTCMLYYNTDLAKLWYWDDTNTVWVVLLN